MDGPAQKERVIPRWAAYSAAAILAVYLLVFGRGLGWQWSGIFSATRAAPAPAAARPVPNSPSSGAPIAAGAARPITSGAVAVAKVALSPTDEPPPRDKSDQHGVYYDPQGVAVLGIDADPGGVYNVPPGRQLRIGGPQGQLFDVQPGGKITAATTVREFPR